eukprot:CAMPEP_0197481686 /NCGR_PEP_ID=MMETSP1309-20131121/48975_1 /TAXON_ID=464262 /ORGANISM="Genus nov. species nov., Strain RCC998" /LENGTH=50 /DNA_ID=CAMNT_0043023989 /DNA_START=36 /DNA_END=184 /DNA_ORIENTATION=-
MPNDDDVVAEEDTWLADACVLPPPRPTFDFSCSTRSSSSQASSMAASTRP